MHVASKPDCDHGASRAGTAGSDGQARPRHLRTYVKRSIALTGAWRNLFVGMRRASLAATEHWRSGTLPLGIPTERRHGSRGSGRPQVPDSQGKETLLYVDQIEWRTVRRDEHGQSGGRRTVQLKDGLRCRKGLWLRLDVPACLLQARDCQALLPERVYVSAQVLRHQAALL